MNPAIQFLYYPGTHLHTPPPNLIITENLAYTLREGVRIANFDHKSIF